MNNQFIVYQLLKGINFNFTLTLFHKTKGIITLNKP